MRVTVEYMVKKSEEPTTRTAQKTHTATAPAESRRDIVSSIARTAFFVIWSVVGMLIAIMLTVAMFGGGTLLESLGSGGSTPNAEQTPTQPQQPPQPTEDQLGCVRDEVGEDRFNELQQGGAPADEKENAAIQKCLQS